MEKRKIGIEVVSLSEPKRIPMDENTIGVNIQNNGTGDIYIGWNEKADTKKCICLPGASRPFGLGYPYYLAGESLYIDFATSSKQCELIIIRDKGPHNC